jgi:membrane protein YdbS with pleckstrin-like domain
MGKNEAEKVIRPPVQQITSGTIFKPSPAYLKKMQFQNILVFVFIVLVVFLSFIAVAYMAASDHENPSAAQIIRDYILPVNLWSLIANLLWFIPALVLTPMYFNSIEYSVKAQSGDTMPEIYSKEGIITITRRHVPFRCITNISSKAGPFDRLFKIGSVHVETAGYSGPNQKGPETVLHGIVFYEEVRDFILRELRKYREPYTTTTEVNQPTPEPASNSDEVLVTLREIRDLLKEK